MQRQSLSRREEAVENGQALISYAHAEYIVKMIFIQSFQNRKKIKIKKNIIRHEVPFAFLQQLPLLVLHFNVKYCTILIFFVHG